MPPANRLSSSQVPRLLLHTFLSHFIVPAVAAGTVAAAPLDRMLVRMLLRLAARPPGPQDGDDVRKLREGLRCGGAGRAVLLSLLSMLSLLLVALAGQGLGAAGAADGAVGTVLVIVGAIIVVTSFNPK